MIFIKIVMCKKPRGYIDTKLNFPSHEMANKYVRDLDEKFEIKRLQGLELSLSNKKRKEVMFARRKKYLLTKEANKFKLWKELK